MTIDKIDQVGKRIREQRKNKNLTIAHLAEAAHISAAYLGEIERCKKVPSLEAYTNIVSVLGISLDICINDKIVTGSPHVLNEVSEMIKDLHPQQLSLIKATVKTMVNQMKDA